MNAHGLLAKYCYNSIGGAFISIWVVVNFTSISQNRGWAFTWHSTVYLVLSTGRKGYNLLNFNLQGYMLKLKWALGKATLIRLWIYRFYLNNTTHMVWILKYLFDTHNWYNFIVMTLGDDLPYNELCVQIWWPSLMLYHIDNIGTSQVLCTNTKL